MRNAPRPRSSTGGDRGPESPRERDAQPRALLRETDAPNSAWQRSLLPSRPRKARVGQTDPRGLRWIRRRMEPNRKVRKQGLEHFIKFVRELPSPSPQAMFRALQEHGYRGQESARRA